MREERRPNRRATICRIDGKLKSRTACTLRAGAEKNDTQKKQVFYCPGPVRDFNYLQFGRCWEAARRRSSWSKDGTEEPTQHLQDRDARQKTSSRPTVCVSGNKPQVFVAAIRFFVGTWRNASLVLRTGGVTSARRAARNTGATARVHDLKIAVAHEYVVSYCVARIGSGYNCVPPTCRLLTL